MQFCASYAVLFDMQFFAAYAVLYTTCRSLHLMQFFTSPAVLFITYTVLLNGKLLF